MTGGDTPHTPERCACFAEVEALHDFFAAWYRGDGVDIETFDTALVPAFRIITPDGHTLDRTSILEAVRRGRSTAPDMEITVIDRGCHQVRGLHIALYEEHQRTGERSSVRLSSAVIGRDGDRWRWHHVHEVWRY